MVYFPLPSDIIDLPSVINNIAHFSQCFQAKAVGPASRSEMQKGNDKKDVRIAKGGEAKKEVEGVAGVGGQPERGACGAGGATGG